MAKNSVLFSINGKPYKVDEEGVNPESKLIDFIRDKAKLKGTKYLCREGGCGACVVTVKCKNPVTGQQTTKSINSCLTPVLSCDGWDISTIEDLGNSKEGYHPIQKRLAEFCGTQCGYCTPGMVMSMYGLMESKNKLLSMKEIEDSLDGNICRCTGYRPILEAFKSFATDVSNDLRQKCTDIEDCLECPCALKKDESEVRPSCCQNGHPSDRILINFTNPDLKWIKVNALENLYDVMQSMAQNNLKIRLVAGNTGIGIFKDDALDVKAFIDITSIPELLRSSYNPSSLVLGGGLSITETINTLKSAAEFHEDFKYAAVIAKHFSGRVANSHIRNISSLAGNLMLKHNHPGFHSDIFLLFEAVGAQITIGCSRSRQSRTISMIEFLARDLKGRLILSIHLPPIPQDFILRTFKITPRYQNSKSYVNAAFLFRVMKSQHFKIVQKPSIVFGGINSKFIHASTTEEFLNGKYLTDLSSMQLALGILDKELIVDEQAISGSPEYRKSLAKSLLYKAILEILGETASKKFQSGGTDLIRGIRKGKQTYIKNKENKILYKGFPKFEAVLQCSGEAEYTNDIQQTDGELFGAFVLSTLANATLKSIDASAALKMKGVAKFIQAKDIPGPNNYMIWEPFPEEIFVSNKVQHAGQPLGLILAESRDIAFAAAKLVHVEYENVQKPILTIEDSIIKAKTEGKLDQLTVRTIKSKQDSGAEAKHVIYGTFRVGGQHHFQMEPHSCLCIPKEDGLDVYSSTQWIDKTQALISSALKIPVNNINVQVRRVGGGFGGKITRSGHIAAACAVAAYVSHRPVRVILDLEHHMRMTGKKLPYKITYEVGFNDSGKIVRLHAKVYCDPGFSPNEETTQYFMMNFQNCYDADGWAVLTGRALTNTPANTFCRGPGHVQGVATIEYIMDHIAFILKKDPWEVRMANLIKRGSDLMPNLDMVYDDENPLQLMIQNFKAENDYEERVKLIEQFNKDNRWRKRGMSIVPVRFPNHYIGGKYNVFVAIYHIDGSVVVSHGGIEMGQGLNTKIAQTVAETLGIPISKVRVKPTNNLASGNSSLTAAGTTSESCCFAAVEACKILINKMAPVKKEFPDASWEKVVAESHNRSIDLTSSYMNESKRDGIKGYDVWSLILTEVEVDILTGEYKVSRLDYSIDGTKSLNPEVDLGQVEGSLIFGLGLWTTEKLVYDQATGQLLTHGTWDYKPPEPKDIPEDFRVTMFTTEANKNGILGSKGPGEPPVCSAISVLLALKQAINSARRDAGNFDWYQLDGPVTPEDVLRLSLTSTLYFQL